MTSQRHPHDFDNGDRAPKRRRTNRSTRSRPNVDFSRASSLGGLVSNVNRIALRTGTRTQSRAHPSAFVRSRSTSPQRAGYRPVQRQGNAPPASNAPQPGTPPPFEFTRAQIAAARNKTFSVGDIVNYECVGQAPVNPRWEWVDDSQTTWAYSKANVHYVPSKDQARDRNIKPTTPAVYSQRRWGIVAAVCDNQPFRGPKLLVFPLFTYDGRGLRHPDGKWQDAAFCVEHLELIHTDDAAAIETQVSNHNIDASDAYETELCNPNSAEYPKFLDERSSHPYVPWGKILRGNHHCPKGTFVRLTSGNEVHMDDPRLEKHGELDAASKKIFRDVMLKVQEMLSTDPADRCKIDVSKYYWLAHLDRFSPPRRQEQADRNEASAQANPQPQTRKRKLSQVEDSSPPQSEEARVAELKSKIVALSPDERLQLLAHFVQQAAERKADLEEGEIEE